MSKKDVHAKQAENLYVIHQMSLKDIAARFGLCYKTVFNWSKDDDWESKRSAAISTSGKTHEDIAEIAKTILCQMRVDQQNGVPIDIDRFNALSKLIETAQRSLKYEQAAPPESKQKLSPEEQGKVFGCKVREILGL